MTTLGDRITTLARGPRIAIRGARTTAAHGLLAASLLAILSIIGYSAHELADAIASGGASTAQGIALDRARHAGELVKASARVDELFVARSDTERALSRAEAELASMREVLARSSAPPPQTTVELVSYAKGAIVRVEGTSGRAGTGFGIRYARGVLGTFVMTATHVLGSSRTATVRYAERGFDATVVATSQADAAILWVPGVMLPLLYQLEHDRSASIGDTVLLRDGVGRTETARIVLISGSVIQVQAPDRGPDYYHGFSGSPLIDSDGRVLGVGADGPGGGLLDYVAFSAMCDLFACS